MRRELTGLQQSKEFCCAKHYVVGKWLYSDAANIF